ncbi:hypothetical protein BV908_09050 [Diaphorobacter sp. LR2014-1]|nr:hypothetical protein BV908_09050 [Diaphorobacter sp. LR2014-1]
MRERVTIDITAHLSPYVINRSFMKLFYFLIVNVFICTLKDFVLICRLNIINQFQQAAEFNWRHSNLIRFIYFLINFFPHVHPYW